MTQREKITQLVVSTLPCSDCGEVGCPYEWGEDRKDLYEQIETLITEGKIEALQKHGNQWRVWLEDTETVKLKDVVDYYDLEISTLQASLKGKKDGK